jgi:hypothetical protein
MASPPHSVPWGPAQRALRNWGNPVAQAVLGAANYATAAVCALTSDQPASACTSVVRAPQAKI